MTRQRHTLTVYAEGPIDYPMVTNVLHNVIPGSVVGIGDPETVPQGDNGFDWNLLNAIADRTRSTETLSPVLMEQFRPILAAAVNPGSASLYTAENVQRMITYPPAWYDTIPRILREYRDAHPQGTVPQGDRDPLDLGPDPTVDARLLALDKIAARLGAQYEWYDAEEDLATIATWITDAGMPNPGETDQVEHYRAEADRLGVSYS